MWFPIGIIAINIDIHIWLEITGYNEWYHFEIQPFIVFPIALHGIESEKSYVVIPPVDKVFKRGFFGGVIA
jgi:hypothetical protein